MTSAIGFEQVCVDYGATRALSDFTLEVAAGQTVALLGPSGSGKSTALKVLAGFERPSSGRVLLDGKDVTALPPHARGLGIVVQRYALFPHMRVDANVAFGLKARKAPRSEVTKRVAEMLEMVGMSDYARRYPSELSGGQQQRVAIARALAISPEVLLLDEPLSALDAKLRQDMLGEIQGLRHDLPSIAMLYVTHDQVEALSLADDIVIMRDGRAVDRGPASTLYHRPPSPFTASFLGDANLLPGVVGAGSVQVEDVTVPCATAGFDAGSKALLCLRPHELQVGDGWSGQLTAVQWRGASYRLSVELVGGHQVKLDMPRQTALPEVGEAITIAPREKAGVLVADGEAA